MRTLYTRFVLDVIIIIQNLNNTRAHIARGTRWTYIQTLSEVISMESSLNRRYHPHNKHEHTNRIALQLVRLYTGCCPCVYPPGICTHGWCVWAGHGNNACWVRVDVFHIFFAHCRIYGTVAATLTRRHLH